MSSRININMGCGIILQKEVTSVLAVTNYIDELTYNLYDQLEFIPVY